MEIQYMGAKNQFICKHCDYEAIVSGGDDVGMACRTTTISCEDCGELFDVLTSEQPWDEFAGLTDEELVCPGTPPDDADDDDSDENPDLSNPDHHVRRWSFLGPCPKCGREMTKGDVIVMWD
jgi:transcription elongation factor Elf1